MMWMLRALWLFVAHDLLEYRYMDDATGNLFSLFCSTWLAVLKMFVRLFRIKASESLEKCLAGAIYKEEKWWNGDKRALAYLRIVVSKWCHLPHFKLFLPHLTMSLHLFTHFAKLIRFVQILSLTLVHFHSTHSFAPFDSQVVALIVRRGRNNLKWGRCHHLLTTQK